MNTRTESLIFPTKNALSSVRTLLQAWRNSGRRQVNESDSKDILATAGLPIPRRSPRQVSVVKFCADAGMHKSELGLVQLHVNPEELQSVTQAMRERAAVAGLQNGVVLVEEMITDCLLEWFVGCRNDATFGPILVLGVGGVYAELFGAPEIRLAPLSQVEAKEAIHAHRAFAIIDGARGRPKADIDRFAVILSAISQLFWETHDVIQELDLNPVIVRPADLTDSIVIADASIVLR